MKLRSSTSHDEGCERDWSVLTKSLSGKDGVLDTLHGVRLEWVAGDDGRMETKEISGSEFDLKADLVLLAMGFVHPVQEGLLNDLAVEYDGRGNVQATELDYQTSVKKVFAAGDMRRGQSLIVWAIREGRQCAGSIDAFLKD